MRSFRANDTTLSPGQSFTLSATVNNTGSGSSGSTVLRYYYWRASSEEWSQVAYDNVAGLRAGGSGYESVSLTAPSRTGSHWYLACVAAVSGERDRDDNCSGNLQITVSGSGGGGSPDLVVQSLRASDATLAAGQWFTLSATVRNVGNGSSVGTALRYYYWQGTWEAVGYDGVGGLTAGGSSYESVRLRGTIEHRASLV